MPCGDPVTAPDVVELGRRAVDEAGRPLCLLCDGQGGWWAEGDPSVNDWIRCDDCHGCGIDFHPNGAALESAPARS